MCTGCAPTFLTPYSCPLLSGEADDAVVEVGSKFPVVPRRVSSEEGPRVLLAYASVRPAVKVYSFIHARILSCVEASQARLCVRKRGMRAQDVGPQRWRGQGP